MNKFFAKSCSVRCEDFFRPTICFGVIGTLILTLCEKYLVVSPISSMFPHSW